MFDPEELPSTPQMIAPPFREGLFFEIWAEWIAGSTEMELRDFSLTRRPLGSFLEGVRLAFS